MIKRPPLAEGRAPRSKTRGLGAKLEEQRAAFEDFAAQEKAKSEQPDVSKVVSDVAGIEDLIALGTGSCELNDMLSDDQWVRSSGKTPLEFLTAVYRHPLVRMNDRIAAAKTVVEYSHRKMPSAIEMTGKDGGALKVTAGMMSGLSDTELETMQALLEKAARAAGGS